MRKRLMVSMVVISVMMNSGCNKSSKLKACLQVSDCGGNSVCIGGFCRNTNNIVNVRVDTYPGSPTNSTEASFGFSCDSTVECRFSCRLNNGNWEECTTPQHYSEVEEGENTFSVKVIDGNGYDLSESVSITWIVDISPPSVTITSFPESTTALKSVTLTFSCSETSCSFTCSLDGGQEVPCEGTFSASGLSDGQHTVLVKAADQAGN